MAALTRLPLMHSPFKPFSLARTLLLALLGICCAASVSAMSLRELRTLVKTEKQGSHYIDYYLVGVMEGVVEAHAQAIRSGAAPVICLNGRRLEPSTAKSLYDNELKRNKDVYEADMPVQLVMFNALSTVYPC